MAGHDRPRDAGRAGHGGWWRMVLFACLFALLQGAYGRAAGTPVERFVVDGLTVGTAGWIVATLDPEAGVRVFGSRLSAPGGGINVLNGCEGTDAAFLLMAALFAAPASWKRRTAGLAAGLALVFVLNQARVIALFYAVRAAPGWFDLLHGLVAPLLLVIATGAFFALWLGTPPRHPETVGRAG
jgi:exosortase family protein XrtM